MPIYRSNFSFNKQLIFVHIPRTGGTYLQRVLSRSLAQDKLTKFRHIQPSSFGHYTYNNILETLRQNQRSTDEKNYFSFAFVRNPFDKILSSYLNFTVNIIPDFDEYISLVQHVVRNEVYWQENYIRRNDLSHYIPQSTMIGEQGLDFVGRFESYHRDIERLYDITKIPALKDIALIKRDVDYRQYYSLRNLRIIEDLYRDDLSAFDYAY